jgi:hypothetical protein
MSVSRITGRRRAVRAGGGSPRKRIRPSTRGASGWRSRTVASRRLTNMPPASGDTSTLASANIE